jgi:hypothetical protein
MKGGARPGAGRKRIAPCSPGCVCLKCRDREAHRVFYARYRRVGGPRETRVSRVEREAELNRKASEWLKGMRA